MKEAETVVAHHNEDLSWLTPEYNATVYTKGLRSVRGHRFVYLFNTGREAHTYLYHICRHYDDLAGVTLFCQGRVEDHLPRPGFSARVLLDMPAKFDVAGLRLCENLYELDDSGRLAHRGKWAKDAFAGDMRLCPLSFAAWWRKNLGEDLVPSKGVTYFPGAIFAVRREAVLRRPREFYHGLLSQLSDHANPEEAYFMERAWLAAFKADPARVARAS